MEFIAVDCLRSVVSFIALDLVVIDAATSFSFLEVRVESIDETLTSISCVAFIHEVASYLVCLTFETAEQTADIDTVECTWLDLECLLAFKHDTILWIVDSIVPVR